MRYRERGRCVRARRFFTFVADSWRARTEKSSILIKERKRERERDEMRPHCDFLIIDVTRSSVIMNYRAIEGLAS